MKYKDTLKNLLLHLGLLEGQATQSDLLTTAANWALNTENTEGYVLKTYQPVALRPVLETLKGHQAVKYRNPEKLSVNLTMPVENPPFTEAYFQQFKEALKVKPDLTTLEVWGSTLAVDSKYNDISLFDFIKTTVGIHECLATDNSQLRLVGGGISGIQSYLYEIISKNAAKLLKGRSFYIQLLTDSLLDELLKEFELSPCHVVYASGGGFYVFMPDTEGVDKFNGFAQRMSEAIYAKHGLALTVDLTVSKAFDSTKPINEIWDKLFVDLSDLKYKRLNNSKTLLTDFFKKVEQGGTREKDPITNEEFKPDDVKKELLDGTIVLESTKQQIDLGRELREAKYWIMSKEPIHGLAVTIIDPFGKYHYLETSIKGINVTNATVLKLNPKDKEVEEQVEPFTFYGGNEFPTHDHDSPDLDKNGKPLFKKGDVKAFDELIDNPNFKRLGILRMDVDGLGGIFSDEKNMTSPKYNLNWTRYVAVSRSLDQFFKGYLNKLQRTLNATETSVIIYSGGDDLFIVGRWDKALVFAEAIYKNFKEWTNGVLTISGGLALLPAKFPIMQGARLTAEAEHKAKTHKYPQNTEGSPKEKNAFTFLNTPLSWDYEFMIVNKLHQEILPLIQSYALPTSFITKIAGFAETHNLHKRLSECTDKIKNNQKLTNEEEKDYYRLKDNNLLRWKWQMAYDLTRFAEKSGNSKAFIRSIMADALTDRFENQALSLKTNYQYIELLNLACRWVELSNRSNTNS